MTVSTNSESNSENSVEEPVQHSGREGADPDSKELILLRKSYDPSARPKVILPKSIRKDDSGVVISHKLQGKRIKDNKSDRLSDIDDLELVGYLCTKEEMHLKRILWEAMNEGHTKAKKQKQSAEKKKGVSMEKASKKTEKVDPERHSSRINYDAFKSLNDELKSCEWDQETALHGSQNSNSSQRENYLIDDFDF